MEALGPIVGGQQHFALLLEAADHRIICAAVVGEGGVVGRKEPLEHF